MHLLGRTTLHTASVTGLASQLAPGTVSIPRGRPLFAQQGLVPGELALVLPNTTRAFWKTITKVDVERIDAVRGRLLVMQSSGGVLSTDAVLDRPAHST